MMEVDGGLWWLTSTGGPHHPTMHADAAAAMFNAVPVTG